MSDRIYAHNGHPHDDEQAALVTAYALGQLSGAEQQELESQLARDPQLQQQIAETRSLAAQLGDVLRREALPATSAELRERVTDQLDFVETMIVSLPAKRRGTWVAAVSGIALAGTAVALMLPGLQFPRDLAYIGSGLMVNGQRLEAESELRQLQDGVQSSQNSGRSARVDAYGEVQPGDLDDLTGLRKRFVPTSGPVSTESAPVAREKLSLAESVVNKSEANYWQDGERGANAGGRDGQQGQAGGSLFGVQLKKANGEAQPGESQPSVAGGGLPAAPLVMNPAPTIVGRPVKELEGRYYATDNAESRAKVKSFELVPKQVTELQAARASGDSLTPRILLESESDKAPVDRLESSVGNEQYDEIVENRFLAPRAEPLSTFSIDVDTASYANMRRFLTGGQLPPPSAVRIEELINYFSYDDPQPVGNAPFSAQMEIAECPWTPGHHLLRIGLKGKEMQNEKRPNSNLVFLLDVSGSMAADNKLPLVKQAMQLLVRELRENDCVTIVTYAGEEGLALDSTSGDQKAKINQAIETLSSGGSTHASAGITLAYEKAQEHFIKDGANRVILCTDGDFNVGVTSDEALVDLITTKAKSGVFLSVLGFGMGNLKDAKMEKLADKGNGNYAYIDTLREGRKVLVDEMAANLVTIAKDVKIQIEFNPAVVSSYRQIGYENRVLAAQDFNDDTKDAGEIGAGHSVTALYEVVLVGNEKATPATPDSEIPLKYQKTATKLPGAGTEPAAAATLTDEAGSGELLTLKLRFKEPLGDKSELLEFPFKEQPKKFGQASENLRFASAVAAFGMLLRQSENRGGATLSAVEEIASASLGKDTNGYRAEFLDLVRRATELTGK